MYVSRAEKLFLDRIRHFFFATLVVALMATAMGFIYTAGRGSYVYGPLIFLMGIILSLSMRWYVKSGRLRKGLEAQMGKVI